MSRLARTTRVQRWDGGTDRAAEPSRWTLGQRTIRRLWRDTPLCLVGLALWVAVILAGWVTAAVLIWEKFGAPHLE